METSNKIRIGVLALQGAFAEHVASLRRVCTDLKNAGENSVDIDIMEIRTADQVNSELDGLIIPGGESTVMRKHGKDSGLLPKMKDWIRLSNKFTWGTCAGLIVLCNHIENEADSMIGNLDITCTRNAFGRQNESFESSLILTDPELKEIAKKDRCLGVFIRAPRIKSINSSSVKVLCRFPPSETNVEAGEPVSVRQGNMMVSTFHPELTDDISWHEYFIKQVIACKAMGL